MTYLFDIGNVLLTFDFTPALKGLSGPNPSQSALTEIISRKDEFEAGQVLQNDYIGWASKLLDYQGSPTEFAHAWNNIFTPVEGTWKLVEKLAAQNHRLILFSNTNPIHAPFILENYSVFDHFHHAVFSHEIQAIKPNSEFFTRAFEKFDIDPTETIYIDDLPENIAAGKRHGLQSFQYDHTNHQALLNWLTKVTP